MFNDSLILNLFLKVRLKLDLISSKTYTLGTTAKPCTVVSGSKVKGTSVTSITSADTERYLVGGTIIMTINAANTSFVIE